jgi:hypothetical protein
MADVQVGTLPQPGQILAPGYQSLHATTLAMAAGKATVPLVRGARSPPSGGGLRFAD